MGTGKRKGSVRMVEWWKHLRWRKKDQEKLVRTDGKKQIKEGSAEVSNYENDRRKRP
jgi:hypothetical protein